MALSNNNITKREKLALISLTLCFFVPSYNYYINEIFMLNFGRGSISAISYVFLAVIGLYSYTYLSRTNIKLVMLMGLAILGMFVSYLLYPEIKDAFIDKDYNPLTSALLFLPLIAFPMMVLTNYLKNQSTLILDYVRVPSLALIVLAIVDYYWTVIVNGHYFDVQYMSFSYFMLAATCLSFAYGMKRGRILDILAAITGLVVILIVGARGCFVCGVTYISLACIKRYSVSLKKTIIFLVFLVSIFLVLSSTFTSLSGNVLSYMNEHDATSRTLMKIDDGTFEESTGRDNIYKIMTNAIIENPVGYGLMGDRYILWQHDNQGYCHSIIYEFLVDYGVILGSILLFILIGFLFIKLKKCIELDQYYILAFLAVAGFVKLLFTGSYLGESYFWGLLGILFNNQDDKIQITR